MGDRLAVLPKAKGRRGAVFHRVGRAQGRLLPWARKRRFVDQAMEEVEIRVQLLPHHRGLPTPQYATAHASGMDLHAALEETVSIPSGKRALIPTGLRIALAPGMEAQVRPRSGLALEHGVTLMNSPGTIDADYRGEIKVLLVNFGERPFSVQRGDRIAQLVIQRVLRGRILVDVVLDETRRNEGGFGHTGR